MTGEEKPYRVYRGGRAKSKSPTGTKGDAPSLGLSGRAAGGGRRRGAGRDGGGAAPAEYRGPGARRSRPRWGRRIALGLLILVVLFVIWGVASYLQFSSGVADANKRLPADAKAALSKQSGLLLSHSTTILVLGADNGQVGRAGDDHSDSIMLVRTDPSHHRLYYLSIPRDLQVPIPGIGTQKINAAMQNGGPPLAIRTIRDFTGVPIDHVVVVNFSAFKQLIDALGGITVNVPKPILSDRFDCPYATQTRCQQWKGWRFAKGSQHMNGERALIYSRVRVNQLDPSESDVTRGARQQAVMQAVMSKFTSPGTLISVPFDGAKLAKPLETDLTASQLVQLAWVKFRSSNGSAIHCRLGGDLGLGGSGSPSEDDPLAIAMFLGKSAPQAPASGDPFAPGCVVGHPPQ